MAAKSRRSRIDDLIARQGEEFARMTEAQERRVLRGLEDARRDLRERLLVLEATGGDTATPFTAQHLRMALVQVESAVGNLRDRLDDTFVGAERQLHDRAVSHLLGIVKRAEPKFRDAGGALDLPILQRLTERRGLALHRHSVQRYGAQLIEAIQRELVVGVASNLTVPQIADRIAGTDRSVFAGARGRAMLIARMELSRAYGDGAQIALEQLAATDPPGTNDPLMKKADEAFDYRNHPFSRALHGRVALPQDDWRVPVAGLPKGALSGLVWKRRGAFVTGFAYPAHYNDRGRMIPHRASWGP